ncbi:MAG: hypothetical protein ACRDNY_11935 [Gaiellaceae bacterium]
MVERFSLLISIAVAVALARSATAAAPNYILVSGPGLAGPVLLSNWSENGALLSAVVSAPRAKHRTVRSLSRRPRFHLAEFWGWRDRPRPTQPRQANQHGWFYPAHCGQPPVIDLTVDGQMVPRIAPRRALRILTRHGVPTQL